MESTRARLETIENMIRRGPFDSSWESLENYRIPSWYKDAKFGIFLHWGVYCVPAFGNEWYPREMYRQESATFKHHREKWGDQSKFGYKDFIPMFKAERFDAGEWAGLFEKAGAKFVVPVAEHHDGFAMYDSGFSDWCAARMGPKRNIVGELASAVRKAGMTFGLSTHREEHWWFYEGGRQFESDVQDDRFRGLYGPAQPEKTQPNEEFLNDWLARTCELVDKFNPAIVWFDWWINQPAYAPYLQKFAAYYYNCAAERGFDAAINYKNTAFPRDAAVLDIERGQLTDIYPLLWQTDTSVSKNSWGYIEGHDYKTATSVIHDLADIVSKNGVLLLNIGPKADGTIPEPEQEMLLEIGRWLDVNGEAIYGTRPFRIFGEGPTLVVGGGHTDYKRAAFTDKDIRFTRKGNALYAILLGIPEGDTVVIKTQGVKSEYRILDIKSVELLGCRECLKWERTDEGLAVKLPDAKPCGHAFALKISG
ncbi:MAG TPA: alpha-L-fucosidase [Candidatus Brocadiia bacterium]|nr:alpha-L-fucosidase [Candidatus Brocadiia bacterium]